MGRMFISTHLTPLYSPHYTLLVHIQIIYITISYTYKLLFHLQINIQVAYLSNMWKVRIIKVYIALSLIIFCLYCRVCVVSQKSST